MSKEQLIQGIYNEVMGKRDQVLAELQVFLDNPAGVGDHGNFATDVKGKIEEIDKLNGLSQTMRNLFMDGSANEQVSSIDAAEVSLPTEPLDGA